MKLDLILAQECRKRLSALKQALIDRAEREAIALQFHALKGDLAYAQDQTLLEDLEKARNAWEKSIAGKGGESCLGILESLENRIAFAEYSAVEDWGSAIVELMQDAVASVANNLGKRIELVADVPFDLRLNGEEAMFLKEALTPIWMNSCVHGVGRSGRIKIKLWSENGQLCARALEESSEELAPPSAAQRYYAGQGLGLKQLRELLLRKGGRLEFDQAGSGGALICVPRKEARL